MRRGTTIALTVGVVLAVAIVVYAGTGAVARALERLHVTGLVALALLHVPIVVMMGFAWFFAAGNAPPASSSRFVWARAVRDAAAEVLPFLQFGGVVFGLRALGRGRVVTVGAVSAGIDAVIELTAKLPYTLAALLALLALAPQLRVTRLLCLALAASGVLVAMLVLARRSLRDRMDGMARALSARWPAVMKDYLVGGDVRACFDHILSQRRRLWCAFALHLCCWFLGAAEVWVAFRLLGTELSMAQALAIDGTVAGLRTFAFMVPAAAGVQEASYLLAAGVFGIPPAEAIAASFARRGRDVLLGVSTLGVAAIGDPQFAVGRA